MLRDKLVGVVDNLILKADESHPSVDTLKANIDQALAGAKSPTRVKVVKNVIHPLTKRRG